MADLRAGRRAGPSDFEKVVLMADQKEFAKVVQRVLLLADQRVVQ
jgi:hypothetical protein